jgi:hypothetical protein
MAGEEPGTARQRKKALQNELRSSGFASAPVIFRVPRIATKLALHSLVAYDTLEPLGLRYRFFTSGDDDRV